MLLCNFEDLNVTSLLAEARRLAPAPDLPEVRVALLSDASTQHLALLLKALLRQAGVSAGIYEGAFAGMELETYDADSALYRFEPQFAVLLTATQALALHYYERTGTAAEFLNSAISRIERIWNAFETHSSGLILQSNFVLPTERLFGNFDHKMPDSLYSVTARLNGLLAEQARKHAGVLVNDVDGIASWFGRRDWFDERMWFSAKLLCALKYLPAVALNIARIVLTARGQVVKCVVLDLDNTLWGGVIGDDGLNGIKLSAHGEGEPFYTFQLFLRELSRRGILLAVCSKNDSNNALEPFLHHPEMVLKRDHIAAFVANWDDKAQNIRRIQQTLNIGFDSMVFLDDNPFERNLVRELLPDVIVPELPEDPSGYLAAISALNLFETVSFSAEDVNRTAMYRAEAERREEQASCASVDDFLRSLDMTITVARWDEFHLSRVAQLIQRSNQFNLTTRRLSEAQCAAMMNDTTGLFAIYAKLSDRLGDHGLISVVTGAPSGADFVIQDWLMSCRVLARGVEQYLMAHVFEHAQTLGASRVVGKYIPTAKNGMVRDFFERFGFTRTTDNPDGTTEWALEVDAFEPAATHIHPVDARVLAAGHAILR